ncbi:hypothetical protein D3C78_969680 [compost metagenome]
MSNIKVRSSPTYVLLEAEKLSKVRSAEAYALVQESPGTSLRKVQGFTLESPIPDAKIRRIVGFSLESVTPTSLFSNLNGLETLRAAIKKEMGVTVTDALATFGDPQPAIDSYNTRVVLTAVSTSEYSGTMGIRYNRFPLEEAFKGKNTSQVIGAATSIHGRLAAINAFFGLKLEPRDVVDKALLPDTPGFTLRVASTSYLYVPNSTMVIGVINGNDLAIEIDNSQMNGFEEIDDLESWIKVSEMNGFTPAT